MKTTFDIIKDITYTKPKYTLQPNDECNPFMIQKWLSFIDPLYTHLMNEVYNVRSNGFMDDQQFYDFMKCVIPKKSIGRIKYIKKTKNVEKSKNENVVEQLAETLEISQREARDMISVYPDILKLYEDKSNLSKKIDKE